MRLLNRNSFVCALLAVLIFAPIDWSDAHHTALHDQNPNPPLALGATDRLDFPSGSLIIPMDSCYQRPSFMADTEIEDILGLADISDEECLSNSAKDDGIIPAYSLMFRLVEDGIPVYWSLKESKASFHDPDFSIVKGSGGPVEEINRSGTQLRSFSLVEVKYRGAPFIIHADDAAAALTAMSGYSQSHTGTSYAEVNIHRALIDFQAPIYSTLEGLPKLAVIDVTDATTGFDGQPTGFNNTVGAIAEALMADLEGTLFEYVTIDEVLADRLTDDGFSIVWLPPLDLPGSTATARQQQVIDKIGAFADAGGNVVAQDGAVAAIEGFGADCGNADCYTETQAPTGSFQMDGGLHENGTSGTWDNGDTDENTVGDDFSDPLSQFGGMVWTGIGGSKYNWRPREDRAYHDGVRRMIYTDHATNSSLDDWDIASWRYKDNDSSKGQIIYLGGDNWRRVTAAGFRILLNTILVSPSVGGDSFEATRAEPVITTVGGVEALYLGTFESSLTPEPATTYSGTADDATFEFPDVIGHMRAISLGTDDFDLEDLELCSDNGNVAPCAIFDVANGLSTTACTGGDPFDENYGALDGSCRAIFTNTTSGNAPTTVLVNTDNRDTLKPFIGASLTDTEADTLISRILAGRFDSDTNTYLPGLGGVDRSTVAVIGPSTVAGSGRSTIVYFGATDGMLHAVCADTVGTECSTVGQELWAFLPGTQLGLLALNQQRIDGSPAVADVLEDFDGNGVREFKTVLTFQAGNTESNAVYGLDISDPAQPVVLWEVATGGPGLGLAMGPADTGGTTGFRHVTFVQTRTVDDQGTATETDDTAGFQVSAINTSDGTVLWTFAQDYPDPRTNTNPVVPTTAIPEGISILSSNGLPEIDTVLVTTLYGDMWILSGDGTNQLGSNPLFRASIDFRPIGAPAAVFRNNETGKLHAVLATGGYADPEAGSTWAPSDQTQFAVTVNLDVDEVGGLAPLSETDSSIAATGDRRFDFTAGQRAFAQATVIGNEFFVLTDDSNVNAATFGSENNTGQLNRLSYVGESAGTLANTVITVQSGVAAAEYAAGSNRFVAGGAKISNNDGSVIDTTGAQSVNPLAQAQVNRLLWLQIE